MNWTPAPWSMKTHSESEIVGHDRLGRPILIATVRGYTGAEITSNARLISAAHDLRLAVIALLEQGAPWPVGSQAAKLAAEALAKVRGNLETEEMK